MYPECKEFKHRNFNLQLLQIQYVQIHVYCNQDLRYRVMQHLKTYKQTIYKHMTTPPLTSPPPACKESVFSLVGQCG